MINAGSWVVCRGVVVVKRERYMTMAEVELMLDYAHNAIPTLNCKCNGKCNCKWYVYCDCGIA